MFLIITQYGLKKKALSHSCLYCQVLSKNLGGAIEELGIAGPGPSLPQVLDMIHSPEHPASKVVDSLGKGTRETKFPSLEQQAWEVSDLLRVGTRDGGVMFLVLWVLGKDQDTFEWWSRRSRDPGGPWRSHCLGSS